MALQWKSRSSTEGWVIQVERRGGGGGVAIVGDGKGNIWLS